MTQYGGYESAEVYRASSDAVGDSIRLMLTVAMLAADIAVERRERRLAQEAAASAERARVEAERLRAERAAAEPVLRSVHQERFWREADPRRIGRAWQAAGEWAESDPYAAYTMQILRERLLDQFGIETPQWTAGGPELARIVTVANPEYQTILARAREDAERSGTASYAVLVRDLEDPYRIVFQGEVHAPAGMPPAAVAAREFQRWAAGEGSERVSGREGQYAVELVENTDHSVRSAQVAAAEVRGDQAAQVLATDEAWQRALIEGTVQGTDAEMMYALISELDRLEAEANRRAERRAEYAGRLDADDLSPRDRARLEGNIQAIDTGLTGLHQQQADAALRMAATAAQLRGESPGHVYDAARLKDSLDEGWWQTASAQEIAGVWEHVGQWAPGQAREEMTQVLRDGVERHHGLLVPKDATPAAVGALFGGQDVPGPAVPLTRQSVALRDQATALFEEAFDATAERIQLEHRMAGEPVAEESDVRAALEALDERAAAATDHARALVQQATWLESNSPAAMQSIYAENNAQAVTELAAAFEERWGKPLREETRQELAEAAAQAEPGASAWSIVAGTGSTDPASVSVLPRVSAQAAGADDADGNSSLVEADGGGGADRDAARRTAAEAALKGVEDQEAVEAVRLAQAAFPEGPEAAVATPPAGVGSNGAGTAPGRQRAAQVEL